MDWITWAMFFLWEVFRHFKCLRLDLWLSRFWEVATWIRGFVFGWLTHVDGLWNRLPTPSGSFHHPIFWWTIFKGRSVFSRLSRNVGVRIFAGVNEAIPTKWREHGRFLSVVMRFLLRNASLVALGECIPWKTLKFNTVLWWFWGFPSEAGSLFPSKCRSLAHFSAENWWFIEISWKYQDKKCAWQFFVTFLGWLSGPFKWLSDLQLGDEKVTDWITWCVCFFLKQVSADGNQQIREIGFKAWPDFLTDALQQRLLNHFKGQKNAAMDWIKNVDFFCRPFCWTTRYCWWKKSG